MLGKLFGSNSRVKILKLFLLHPEEKYYIRQLSRDLGLQLNSVRRELENLEKFGLLTSDTSVDESDAYEIKRTKSGKKIVDLKKKSEDSVAKNEKKYYQVNKNFILFEEIKALIVKAQMLYERDFVKKIEKLGIPKLFLLTGFFVNNTSPVDILLVGKFNRQKASALITELENDLGREFNYTIMDMKEYKFRRDMTDVFLYNILEGEKLIIIDELGVS